MTNPLVSIVICTYNRAKILKITLDSIRTMSVPEDLSWEIIVVDNNSKDNTKDVVEDFKAQTKLNVLYIFEARQGKPYALNDGLRFAKGDIIAFTDDDVIVDKYWLVNIVKAFKDTNAACIGGKVLPLWEKTPPKWLKKDLYGILALLDLGDNYLRLTESSVWGVNMAVKSSVIKKHRYQFNVKFLKRGEDSDLINTLLTKEENVYYCPDMLVNHRIPEIRMKKTYFRKWRYEQGKFIGIQMGNRLSCKNVMGIPLFALRYMVKKLIKYLIFLIVKPDKAFLEQVGFIYYMGIIVGRIKYQTAFQ